MHIFVQIQTSQHFLSLFPFFLSQSSRWGRGRGLCWSRGFTRSMHHLLFHFSTFSGRPLAKHITFPSHAFSSSFNTATDEHSHIHAGIKLHFYMRIEQASVWKLNSARAGPSTVHEKFSGGSCLNYQVRRSDTLQWSNNRMKQQKKKV